MYKEKIMKELGYYLLQSLKVTVYKVVRRSNLCVFNIPTTRYYSLLHFYPFSFEIRNKALIMIVLHACSNIVGIKPCLILILKK